MISILLITIVIHLTLLYFFALIFISFYIDHEKDFIRFLDVLKKMQVTNKFLKDFVFQKNFKKIDWEQQGNRFILNESSYYIIHCAEDFPISEKVINTAIRRNKDFNNLILTTNKNVSNEVLNIIKR